MRPMVLGVFDDLAALNSASGIETPKVEMCFRPLTAMCNKNAGFALGIDRRLAAESGSAFAQNDVVVPPPKYWSLIVSRNRLVTELPGAARAIGADLCHLSITSINTTVFGSSDEVMSAGYSSMKVSNASTPFSSTYAVIAS